MEPSINRDWFRDKMKAAHVSQADIAARMGVHPSAVHRLLTGEHRMTIYHVKHFMDMLDVSLEEIFLNMGVELSDKSFPSEGKMDRGRRVENA